MMYRKLFLILAVLWSWSCSKDNDQGFTKELKEVQEVLKKAKAIKPIDGDSSIYYASKAYAIANELSFQTELEESAILLGELNFRKGEFDRASEFLTSTLQSGKELEKSARLGTIYNLLGRIFQYNEQPGIAKEYYEKAKSVFEAIKNQEGLAKIYGNLGHLKEKEGAYDSALFYQEKALAIYSLLEDSLGIATIYDNIGSVHEDLGNYWIALPNFRNAYLINQRVGNEADGIINLNNMGDIFRKTGNYSKALEITTQVLSEAKNLNQLYQIRSAYRDLGKIYLDMGNSLNAYIYLDSSYQLNKAIYSQEIAKEIADTRAFYEIEQKEQQIKLLKKDQEINRVTRIALIGIAGLLLGIGGLVYLQLDTRIKKNKKLYEAEKEIAKVNQERLNSKTA